MLDYPTLRFLCWLLTGVLLIGFAIMDGHDLGIGALLPWLARNDNQRRVLLNTIGPHWDGNQVWLVSAAGMLFAAWPLVYATAFSTMYWVMMAALWALFLRPVGFDFRSKLENRRWRAFWDACLFISGAFPPCCSASLSAIYFWACPSASITRCASNTAAASGPAGNPSRCYAVCWRCAWRYFKLPAF